MITLLPQMPQMPQMPQVPQGSGSLMSHASGRLVIWVTAIAVVAMSLGLLVSPRADAEPVGETVPLERGGLVAVWGEDYSNLLYPPTVLRDKVVTGIDASTGNRSIAVTSDGQVATWGTGAGDAYGGEIPSSLTGKRVTAVAAGHTHYLALTSAGVVTAWGGHNARGELDVPAVLSGRPVKAVAAGRFFSMALTADGQIVAWGDNEHGQVSVPPALLGKTVRAIGAGDDHALAVTSDGRVTAWGEDDYGRLDVPASLADRRVVMVDGGSEHSMALTSDGGVVAWGYNLYGQSTVPAGLRHRTVTSIAAGGRHSMALTASGDVFAWGVNALGRGALPPTLSGKNVTAIAAGFLHSMAIIAPGPPSMLPTPTPMAAPRTAHTTGVPSKGKVYTRSGSTRISLTGRAVPNAAVTLLDNSRALGTAAADSRGQWTITVAAASGTHRYTTTQAKDGRTSAPSAPNLVVVERLAVTLVKKSNPTKTTRPLIRGRGNPGASITLRTSTGKLLGRAAVATSGAWRLRSKKLRVGLTKVCATQTIAGTRTQSSVSRIRVTRTNR